MTESNVYRRHGTVYGYGGDVVVDDDNNAIEPPVFGVGYQNHDGEGDGSTASILVEKNMYSCYGPSSSSTATCDHPAPIVLSSRAEPPPWMVPSSLSSMSVTNNNNNIEAAEIERGRFRAAGVLSQIQQEVATAAAATTTTTTKMADNAISSSTDMEEEVQRGRSRALEILSQIQQKGQTGADLAAPILSNSNSAVSAKFTIFEPPPIISPSEYAERRRVCFEWLGNRKHLALLKNLDYVVRREEQRMEDRMKQIQQAQAYEQQLEGRHQRRLHYLQEQRQQHRQGQYQRNDSSVNENTCQKTSFNRRLEKKRSGSGVESSSTVAVYITGLPVGLSDYNANDRVGDNNGGGGHNQNGTQLKDVLHRLFGSFGVLRKIHIYTEKDTGRWKGDALVIYQNPDDDDGDNDVSSFVDLVCSQMNGCELPGNVVLKVEPSDPLHKKRRASGNPMRADQDEVMKERPDRKCGTVNRSECSISSEDTHSKQAYRKQLEHQDSVQGCGNEDEVETDNGQGLQDNQDDDLDGFFASLE